MINPRVLSLMFLLAATGNVFGEDVEESWTDFNFVPCEGIGVHGSGKIKAFASITRTNSGITVHTLRITSSHPHASGFSSTIHYKDQSGTDNKVILVHPWYATIGPVGDRSRVLPRNKTHTSSGPKEQMEIFVGSEGKIRISANVIFNLDGGNCAAGFSQDWKL